MRRPLFQALGWAIPFRASWGRFSFAGGPHRACYSSRHVPLTSHPVSLKRCFTSCKITRSALDGDSTIYALSTAPGRAAIAVVRVSGPACVQVGQTSSNKAIARQQRLIYFITRYTKLFVPRNLIQNRALRLSVLSTTQRKSHLATALSTPVPSSCIFRGRRQLQARMYLNCMSMAVQLLLKPFSWQLRIQAAGTRWFDMPSLVNSRVARS